jgi:hypothetical protein
MSMIISVLLAAAQPAAPAAAPDWRPLGTVRDGQFALFYDRARIGRGAGDLVTIWLKREAATAPQSQNHAVSRVEIRCIARTVRVVETVTRRADGTLVGTDTEPQPFDSIPAGSFVETIHRDVC